MLARADEQESIVPIAQQTKRGTVIIVGRESLTASLLAKAIIERLSCLAITVRPCDVLRTLRSGDASLVIASADLNSGSDSVFDLVRSMCEEHSGMPVIVLLNEPSHDLVVRAFRAGARGVFLAQDSIDEFIDCVEHARNGAIWAGKQATESLLKVLKTIPAPNALSDHDASMLTTRELQVVQCAATGKTNRSIASELHLSEHTVKNYLFRAFEKLGVSSRVELLFYLTLHGHACGPHGPGADQIED